VLAKSKGIAAKQCLKEAGGKLLPRRTEIAYKGCYRWVSLHNKTKPDSYSESVTVNAAGIWKEGYRSYSGRSAQQLAAAKHQPKRQRFMAT